MVNKSKSNKKMFSYRVRDYQYSVKTSSRRNGRADVTVYGKNGTQLAGTFILKDGHTVSVSGLAEEVKQKFFVDNFWVNQPTFTINVVVSIPEGLITFAVLYSTTTSTGTILPGALTSIQELNKPLNQV